MKEKLIENSHKPDLTKLPLDEAIKYMKGELWELIEELHEDTWDYKKIRRELADVVNFAGAAICACDRVKGVKG